MSRIEITDLVAEVERQDRKHGPYEGTELGRSRLALATMEDELAEALEAWRAERGARGWTRTRTEVLQVAAVAMRTLRDALPEPSEPTSLPDVPVGERAQKRMGWRP